MAASVSDPSQAGGSAGLAPSISPAKAAPRGDGWFCDQLRQIAERTDRRFAGLMAAQWLLGIILAATVSPRLPPGLPGGVPHPLYVAIFLGALISGVPITFACAYPGRQVTRHAIAIGQMLTSALLVDLTGGRVETHFHVFGSLAFLAFYRDWSVLVTASVVALFFHSGHCLADAMLGAPSPGWAGRFLEYAAWIFFEDFFLIVSISAGLREMRSLADDRSRLEQVNDELASTQQESNTILATINQGLFLLSADGRIGRQHSRALEYIFRAPALAGRDFLQLLEPLVSEKIWASTRDYLDLLFDAGRRERQLLRLNPLAQVEVHLPTPPTGRLIKHLEFAFSRVYAEGRVTHLLITVTDASNRVALERQLQTSERKKRREIEMLFNILHVDARLLEEFILGAETALREMSAVLRQAVPPAAHGPGSETSALAREALRNKLSGVLRNIHSLKGNAAVLRLGYFETKAHEVEEEILRLQERPALKGEDLLGIVVKQGGLLTDLNELKDLLGRISRFQVSLDPPATAPIESPRAEESHSPARPAPPHSTATDLFDSVDKYVRTLGERLGKEVSFSYEDFAGIEVPAKYKELLKDVLIQLARNSLIHGIESPEERSAAKKPLRGQLQIYRPAKAESGGFEFVFRDDGRGLPFDKLRRLAVSRGAATVAEVEKWDVELLAALIFDPGISTAEGVTSDAGRGIGMDVIKARVVDECGGRIEVSSTSGEHCTFHIELPP